MKLGSVRKKLVKCAGRAPGEYVSPDLRSALLLVAQALPAGSAVPVVRETLIELLASGEEPQPAEPERMLTAADVAKLLGTTERSAYTHADQLGAIRLSHRLADR
jgi:hypothetical protein